MNRQYCLDQLKRLSGLPGYPKTEEGQRSLVDAFQSAFPEAANLRLWVDDLLHSAERCPLPRDAYRAGYQCRPGRSTGAGYRCTICYDSGQVADEFLITWRDGRRFYQPLTPAQAETLWEKHRAAQKRGERSAMLEAGKQMIYTAPIQCVCRAGGAA